MVLAEQIKKVATAHGMTISDIAKKLGVKQPQISRTINSSRMNLKDMETIANIIGCDVSDFFAHNKEAHSVIIDGIEYAPKEKGASV